MGTVGENLLAYLLVGGGFVALTEVAKLLISRFSTAQGDMLEAKRDNFTAHTARLEAYIVRLEEDVKELRADLESERKQRTVLEMRVGRLMFFVERVHSIIVLDCPNGATCPLLPFVSGTVQDKLPRFSAAVAEEKRKTAEEDGRIEKVKREQESE